MKIKKNDCSLESYFICFSLNSYYSKDISEDIE